MSERYSIPAEDVLGENYKITSIGCSDYNPNIDNSITVTITVTDVYGDAISGESVTVTASEGNFTQLNGSNITNASSVTGTTNSSGQFTLTYSCTEWGLITFSANNRIIQVNVTGFKQIKNYASGFYTLSVDKSKRMVKLRAYVSNTTLSSGESYKQTGWIDSTYCPSGAIVSYLTRLRTVELFVEANGNVSLYNTSSSTQNNFSGSTIVYWDY